jgi:hypothetical protein
MVQRLIAQGVLWAMLTGMFAPLAPAAAMPHACCLRHQQRCHMPHDAGITNRNCCHQCCRFLAVSTALFAPVGPGAQGNLPRSQLISSSGLAFQSFRALTERSERAPPAAN